MVSLKEGGAVYQNVCGCFIFSDDMSKKKALKGEFENYVREFDSLPIFSHRG